MRREKTASALFGNIVQDYLDTLEADLSTHMSYENYWMQFDNYLISDVTRDDIKKVLSVRRDITQKTKKNALVPLKGIFAHAIDQSYIGTNPAIGIKLAKHQRPPIQRFKSEERDILVDRA